MSRHRRSIPALSSRPARGGDPFLAPASAGRRRRRARRVPAAAAAVALAAATAAVAPAMPLPDAGATAAATTIGLPSVRGHVSLVETFAPLDAGPSRRPELQANAVVAIDPPWARRIEPGERSAWLQAVLVPVLPDWLARSLEVTDRGDVVRRVPPAAAFPPVSTAFAAPWMDGVDAVDGVDVGARLVGVADATGAALRTVGGRVAGDPIAALGAGFLGFVLFVPLLCSLLAQRVSGVRRAAVAGGSTEAPDAAPVGIASIVAGVALY